MKKTEKKTCCEGEKLFTLKEWRLEVKTQKVIGKIDLF